MQFVFFGVIEMHISLQDMLEIRPFWEQCAATTGYTVNSLQRHMGAFIKHPMSS